MEAVYIAALSVIALYLLTPLIGIISTLFLYRKYPLVNSDERLVSILVAARNEKKTILRCMESLNRLDYPVSMLEILIGNDQSEDRTAEIVLNYIEGKPQFRMLEIKAGTGHLRGKTNVLAQLARASAGEFLLITDADTRVHPAWVRSMLSGFGKQTGTVSGTTIMEGGSLFARMQSLEWTYYMGMIKAVGDIGIPSTGVGNNMAVLRKAYESVGGYEGIPFSITEDHLLFMELTKKGWKWTQLMQPDNLNISLAVEDLDTFYKQRRRWMAGATDLPLFWWGVFGIFALFYPALMVIMIGINFWQGLVIWLVKVALQSLLLSMQLKKLNQPFRFADSLQYELYCIFNALITPLIQIIRRKVSWKGRDY